MTEREGKCRSPLLFILVIFLLTIPFFWFGNAPVLPASFHIYAPAFIFASILPVSAATVFLYRECGWDGVRDLWKRIFDYRQIADKRWLLPTVLLMPATMVASYFSMRMMGKSIPDSHISIFIAPVLFVVFCVFAIGEEGGWSGYAIDGLQKRWTALTSSIVLGSVWAAWHIVPYVQAHHSSNWWVVWQCLDTVVLRILMVWIYNNTGRSLFAMVLFHAMINESEILFPNLGSYYDPFFPFVILTAMAAVVVFLWGGKTLARYRFAI